MISDVRPITPEFRSQIGREATASLHPTWVSAELEFYRSRNGVLFAGVFRRDPLLLAADPIYDGDPESLAVGLADLMREFPHARSLALVGVSAELVAAMPPRFRIQAMQVGAEPWLSLSAYEARGNRGRGIRSARNQALRAGILVSQIDGLRIARAGSDERERTSRLLSAWRNQGVLEIGGFLQPVDLFHDAANRFYFAARDAEGEWVGLLAATRIGETRSVFLEDLILDPRAESGTGELLTLEALRHFAELGFSDASLGAVSLTRVGAHAACPPARAVVRGFVNVARIVRCFYNAEGIELFRKRFPVKAWRPLLFGVARADGRAPGIADWTWAVIGILLAHRPRLVLTPSRLRTPIVGFLRLRPVQFAFAALVLAFFLAHVPKRAHAAHHRLGWPVVQEKENGAR